MPVDHFHSFAATSFGGIPCAQWWCDLLLWEALLNENPQVKAIVEIGTWQGGFSWFLWAQTQARGLEFQTYDAQDPDREPPGFIRLDVWREVDELRDSLPEWGPIVLFCDGGNKPRELKTFPPFCAPGSVFVVHDWGTETLQKDVPDFLEEVYGEYCDSIGSASRVFKMAGS